ncbi:hypothetical protein KC887_08570, partial [Candidatus Kaiserbacteria bacterium]|nr:hypothetical protein [Candidatus Kaiserbacteria bacterium]
THDHSGGDGAQIDYTTLANLPTLGTAAATDATDYAVAAKGVTNGDTHDHSGGDGAQIAYGSLSGTPTLGTAAAAATGDFEAAGGIATHNAVTTAHGISAFGATLVDDADSATARGTLGLGTAATAASSAFEASGAVSTHAALTTTHGISAFGATLVDDADAATARTTLGVPGGSGTSTGTNTGDSATPAETTTTIGTLINGATSKTTPVDADKVSFWDSVSGLLQSVTWANIKTTLESTFAVLGGKSGGQILTGGTGNSDLLVLKATSGNGSSGIGFRVLVGNNGAAEALTIGNNGKVGISNPSPSVNLDVIGSMLLTGGTVTIVNTGASASASFNRTDGGALAFGGASSPLAVMAFPDNGTLNIRSEPRADVENRVLNTGTAILTVAGASRFVGIGTETPSAKLHVINTTEQLRIGYDSSNYAASTTSSVGATTTALVGTTPSAKWTVSDATTNAIYDVATFSKNSTGAGAAGLGVRINLAAKSSTTADTVFGAITASSVDATHATRKGRTRLWAGDSTGLREGLRVEADGTQVLLGFFGGPAGAKPTALTATVAAAPAGGTGTAAGGWDTAVNRDLAIATINNLKTRVDQLETKLQSLSLLA